MPILVLFDVDGTLVRVPAGRRAFRAAFQEVLGVPHADADFDFSGQTDGWAFRTLAARAGHPDADINRLTQRYLAHLRTMMAADPGIMVPGSDLFVRRLAANSRYRLALGTGNVEEGARAKLEAHGLHSFFPTGGFGDDAILRRDVLAAGIQKAQRHYRMQFERVVVIGDAPQDIEAARTVGAGVVAVATGRPSWETLRKWKPDVLLPDLSDSERAERAVLTAAASVQTESPP